MMIQEAARSWNVKEKTIFDYILKGYIYDLSIENNEIIIPNIPKPYVRRKPKNVKQQDNYILNAINKEMYVNAKIMGISQEQFEGRLKVLIQCKSILPKVESLLDYTSILGFTIAPNQDKLAHVTIGPKVNLNLTVKIADQVGFVNGKVG